MAYQKVLLKEESMEAGEEVRVLPGLDVSSRDRLHFHISGGVRGIADMNVRVLFGTAFSGFAKS